MTKIDIFSGFLGAGKTTLIKKLIKEAFAGQQVVLIENEFGEIGIDGGFLKESGIQINELNAGCICCSLVGDFRTALQQVVEQYHPDRIVIEPSGVGKLSDVTRAVEGVAEHLDVQLDKLCHRGRCEQGEDVYEELRRVLRRPDQPRKLHPAQPHPDRQRREDRRCGRPCCARKTPPLPS